MILSKEQILGSNDRTVETVEIPEWGGEVNVISMSGSQRDKFEISIQDDEDPKKKNLDNIRAKVCSWCIVDEYNNRIFSEKDVNALGEKSAKALDKIFDVALKLSGIRKQEDENGSSKTQDVVDELKENFS